MMDYEKTEGGILVPSSGIQVSGKYTGQIIRNGKIGRHRLNSSHT